tara:strand:- start:133 stop:960 length:828 start_codon:yes stop_codon:yes gene_type:complete
MRLTQYAKDGILNHYFGGTAGGAWDNTSITKMRAALFTQEPPVSGSSFTGEITGLGREDITFGSVSQHVITNSSKITFSTSGTGLNGTTATHLAIIDDHSSSANLVGYGFLTNPITIDTAKDIEIAVDALAVGFDTNSLATAVNEHYAMPDAIVDEILDFVFLLGTVPSQPSAWSLSLHTNESLDGSQHEWSGSGYSRKSITWNPVGSGSGNFREVTNTGAIQFENQTQTPVAMWGIWDQTGSKLLAVNDVDPDAAITSGNTVSFADQAIKISID